MIPRHAKIKFNGGRGALLCNTCNTIIRQNFDPHTIEDKKWYCERHTNEINSPRPQRSGEELRR
ncbi:hypothetical protein [Bradyrhizobium erythrophlei]|uniref:Uncharacterized protein n=1 Tax=Bradyrhizobium erythrophlei TaxID=1437360 RepID=A0A1M5T9T8_9BRAD|nr:hypothetical protein [Bradyrhizobium erythrophlei]SHH47499.1 hypothetical protein SAMN05444169_7636 [Bradyrhizobium erythrophlei]